MGKSMNADISGMELPQEWIDEVGSVSTEDRKVKAIEMRGRNGALKIFRRPRSSYKAEAVSPPPPASRPAGELRP
jgi:hypothetical protein